MAVVFGSVALLGLMVGFIAGFVEKDEGFAFIVAISGLILTLCIYIETRDAWRRELVSRGYAEYVADSQGKVTWRWTEDETK